MTDNCVEANHMERSTHESSTDNDGPSLDNIAQKLDGPGPMTAKQGCQRGNMNNNNSDTHSLLEVLIGQQQLQAKERREEQLADGQQEQCAELCEERQQECHDKMMLQAMMASISVFGGLMQDCRGGTTASTDIAQMTNAALDSDDSHKKSSSEEEDNAEEESNAEKLPKHKTCRT